MNHHLTGEIGNRHKTDIRYIGRRTVIIFDGSRYIRFGPGVDRIVVIQHAAGFLGQSKLHIGQHRAGDADKFVGKIVTREFGDAVYPGRVIHDARRAVDHRDDEPAAICITVFSITRITDGDSSRIVVIRHKEYIRQVRRGIHIIFLVRRHGGIIV
ncbi:hypothetical protein SDC9_132449 [bioreactor metagenome]|uniref:Uncharacterized protein n=1 Tax=bioreactor metagenome TaxID=1076179 RepID=A0A645D827_9ZZZZ